MADTQDNTTPGRSPAFQFYPKDFLSDSNVVGMSMQERGVYITLICICWNEGALPSDVDRIARLCGTKSIVMRKLWPALARCFRPHPSDPELLVHPRLERELSKQADYRRRQSDKGRASGASRRNHGSHPVQPESNHGSTGVQPHTSKQPEPNTNSSSSSSSSDSSHKNTARVSEFPKAAKATDEKTALALRAGDFLERYGDLHVRLRKGARYVGKPHFDFQEAMQLVEAYDDARLDKLAFVWLNTDHDFAQNGTRTLAKFRSMASWCEEQLIAWESKNGALAVNQ